MATYSTREVARKLGLHLVTLQRYIAARKIRIPKVRLVGSLAVRLWTERDIERVRKQLPKIANGRRKKSKKKKAKK